MTATTWLTTAQAAGRLGVSVGDIVDLIFDAELEGRPAADYGRLMVRESDLEHYKARHAEPADN